MRRRSLADGSLPSRALVSLVVVSAALSLATVHQASARDLDDRRDRISQEIGRTQRQLDQSSGQLVAATGALREARRSLDAARTTLAQTRGELAVAQARDAQMRAELAEAVEDLRRAREKLLRGRTLVRDQERALGQVAVQSYQTGDPALLALSMVLNSQDTVELSSQLGSAQSLMAKEAAALQRFEASRALLTAQEEEYEQAKEDVAGQRAAAAANLERKEALERRAAEEESRIATLVNARAAARNAAAQARANDLDQLRGLEAERERVAAMLRRRAEIARAKAAAEAAARAREAARARAAERRRQAAHDRADRPAPAPIAPEPDPAPAPALTALAYPVDGYVTSSYGMRLHPVYRRWSLHDGTDFGASCGTPVRAGEGGRVVAVYYNSAYGNRVIIDHGYTRGVGLGTSYNHLSAYSTYVGQRVERGDVIGYVGTTGASTGCHLHFMVFEDGGTVDPMSWL